MILIQHQILVTNVQGNVKQLEGRINNPILVVKLGFTFLQVNQTLRSQELRK